MEGITGHTTGHRGHRTTDEYGNPINQQEHHGGAGGVTGMLHRTDSSSSSEDDGLGGRRKKGIKEKIKEKLPGGHRSDQMTSTTTPGAYVYDGNQHGHVHEKKGMTEKIKDKLPGHNA